MEHEFYLVIPLGFEEIALKEFELKWPLIFDEASPKGVLSEGGITFQTTLQRGNLLNFYLKIPTRILLRIDHFKARDFPKLYEKLLKVPWNQFLRGQIPSLEFSSKESRIFDSRKVEKTLTSSIKEFYKRNPPKKKHRSDLENLVEQKIFIRAAKDEFVISIDTTGPRLHFRNYRTHIGKAPMRPNLAAGLAFFISDFSPSNFTLVDPMCGSGTFLLEAANFWKNLERKNFPFLFFPCLCSWTPPKGVSLKEESLFKNFVGKDLDEKVLFFAKENLKLLGDFPVEFFKEDFFDENSKKDEDEVVIVSNPPYGERLEEGKISAKFFENFLEVALKKYRVQKIGLIIPTKFELEKIPSNLKLIKKLKFKNGGLPTAFYIWQIG